MAQCPKCELDIDHLNVIVDERNIYRWNKGDGHYSDHVELIDSQVQWFRCPECHEIIADDEDEADEILK